MALRPPDPDSAPDPLEVPTTPDVLRSAALLYLGHRVLAEYDLNETAPVQLVCYVTAEPELARTFHLRTRRGRARAGHVRVTSAALYQQDVRIARDAVTWLLRMAAEQGLPTVKQTAPAPLVGLWSAHPPDVDAQQRPQGVPRTRTQRPPTE